MALQSPNPSGTGRQRRSVGKGRPLAAALALGREHAESIEQSHERCAAIGLSRIERLDHDPLGRSDLSLARERNRRLHGHAAPVMEMLHEQIVNTGSMVLLCDATGTIIHSIGDDDFLARASKVALQPGVNWSEPAKGTNAIGTALVDEAPRLVHADEHFMHANHFLTCSAAPILDPRGNVLGVLDVTGDQHAYHQHTMALVKMSARMIENHWLTDDYISQMRLHFHVRPECIGTLMEGILAVSPDGRIVGANRSALDQLGLGSAALRMHSLASLLGTSVPELVDHFRSPVAVPMAVPLPDGRRLHLQARFNWPAWHALAGGQGPWRPAAVSAAAAATTAAALPASLPLAAPAAVLPARAGPQPEPGPDAAGTALARLDTGDTQMRSLVGKLRRVLDRDIAVLILGETGTGQEELARAFHADSSRAQQPFVALNCAAMPASLIEAALFGSSDGASPGCLVQAQGGTLFLDEIDELPLAVQARLLHRLQDRPRMPTPQSGAAGSSAVAVDIALACATSRPLRELIRGGRFREDLYHRLNGLALRLPPLRERSDLPVLAQRILWQESPRHALRLSPEVQAMFQSCSWPGNLRQLHSVLRTAAVLAGQDDCIRREHLGDDFLDEVPAAAANAAGSAAPPHRPGQRSLEEVELDTIRSTVEALGGNISEASKRLGISRNTIYRKLRWRQTAG